MYNNEEYDIAIIGGGLAGLSLAIQAADVGYKTVLFEKEQYPFHKVCGEYISNECYGFLQRLGIDLPSLSLPHIHQLTITDAAGKTYQFPLDLGGFGISRFCLDNLLYQQAVAKGISVFTKTKVNDATFENDGFTIKTSNEIYRAKTTCGAFGKRSNLDIQWQRNFAQQKPNKLNNYIGIKYHVRYPHPVNTIALHNFQDGYCGISRIENDTCCVCYLTTANNLKKYGNNIATMETELLSQNPFLKRIFNEATFLYKQPLAISQISFDKKTGAENGVLMLGDAAGLITPLCGNGMSMAMHASVLAFQNIRLYLEGNISRREMEQRYLSEWKGLFAKRLLAGRMIQRVFGGKRTTSLFLQTMKAFPALANALIRSTHGKPF